MQMWTFQKVLLLMLIRLFQQKTTGKPCRLWGKWFSERRKDCLASLNLNPLRRWQKWVLGWEAFCLSSDWALRVSRGRTDFSILLQHCPGHWGKTCQVWPFQGSGFSASAKSWIIVISSQPLTINGITLQAAFLERFLCKWRRKTSGALLHSTAHPALCRNVQSTAALSLENVQTFPWLPFLLFLVLQPPNPTLLTLSSAWMISLSVRSEKTTGSPFMKTISVQLSICKKCTRLQKPWRG